MDSVFDSSRRLFQYFNEDSSLIYRLDIYMNSDTTIIFNGETILEEDNKQFIIDNKTVGVYKYYYDIDNQDDEEAYIFINHLCGIVGINYFPWGLSIFPEGKNKLEDFETVLFKPENDSFFEW